VRKVEFIMLILRGPAKAAWVKIHKDVQVGSKLEVF
jgi:hypothetical protein